MNLSILNQLFTKCWWWLLLWMFLAFLLGWLLRKFFGGTTDDCCDELKNYRTRFTELESKYNSLLNKDQNLFTTNKKNVKKNSVTDITVAQKASNKSKSISPYDKLRKENLQIIEGIGPKMEDILKKNSINTWQDLSSSSADEIRKILDDENPTRYKIIDPSTWAQQAKLAVEKNWEALINLQKGLDTGKATNIGITDSKLEKIMIKKGLLKKWKQDDLKAIEGIGPKIAKLLNEAGINTWEALSSTSVTVLNEILKKAGKRFKLANPGTWPKQAKLANEGKWEELQKYQDELDGGR